MDRHAPYSTFKERFPLPCTKQRVCTLLALPEVFTPGSELLAHRPKTHYTTPQATCQRRLSPFLGRRPTGLFKHVHFELSSWRMMPDERGEHPLDELKFPALRGLPGLHPVRQAFLHVGHRIIRALLVFHHDRPTKVESFQLLRHG